jgi:hypothetical protein
MKTNRLHILIILMFFSVIQIANADKVPQLTRFIDTEILTLSDAIERNSKLTNEADINSKFTFKQFLIRLQATIGIEVPWTVTMQIVPEVELLWEKK